MSGGELEDAFPNLRASGYRITSPAAETPNCIGWALHDTSSFWDPALTGFRGVYYWPPGIPRTDSLEAWIQLFELHGYRECESAELEAQTEKIAIYADASEVPQHVARQLRSGAWTSKLGSDDDIEHQILDGLVGTVYGTVVKVMKRSLPQADYLSNEDIAT